MFGKQLRIFVVFSPEKLKKASGLTGYVKRSEVVPPPCPEVPHTTQGAVGGRQFAGPFIWTHWPATGSQLKTQQPGSLGLQVVVVVLLVVPVVPVVVGPQHGAAGVP
jgi:hypothetical protein